METTPLEGRAMEDTHPDFFNHVALLAEAGRLDPRWGATVWEAKDDEAMDVKVEEAKAIIEAASDQAWI